MPSKAFQANIRVAHQISSTLHVEAFAHHGAVGTMSSAESIIAVDVSQLTDGSPKCRHLVLVQWERKVEDVAVVWAVEGGVTRVHAFKDAKMAFGCVTSSKLTDFHCTSFSALILLPAGSTPASREVPSNVHRFTSNVNLSRYALLTTL